MQEIRFVVVGGGVLLLGLRILQPHRPINLELHFILDIIFIIESNYKIASILFQW